MRDEGGRRRDEGREEEEEGPPAKTNLCLPNNNLNY